MSWIISCRHISGVCITRCCCRAAPLQATPCLSTSSVSPVMVTERAGKCPGAGQVMRSRRCGIFIQTDISGKDEFSRSKGPSILFFCTNTLLPLKLHGSNPAQYFRRCQTVSLWLFMTSNVFPFIAYFRYNKREMKGPLKENALPWHLSTL